MGGGDYSLSSLQRRGEARRAFTDHADGGGGIDVDAHHFVKSLLRRGLGRQRSERGRGWC